VTPVEEAEEASFAFRSALARIGVATVAEAIALWSRLNPAKISATAGAWLDDAVTMILSRRGESRELAIAYYRLVRALRTGSTVPRPGEVEPTYIPLGKLRQEFAELIADTELAWAPAGVPTDEQDSVRAERAQEAYSDRAPTYSQPSTGDDEAVRVETEFSSDPDEEIRRLEAEIAERDRLAEKEAELVMEQLGARLLEKKLAEAEKAKEADDRDAVRDGAHTQAGARQAAAAERIVLNGARDEIAARIKRDRRVIGYVRLPRTGTPCGFCAMLISREVLYLSRATAGGRSANTESVLMGASGDDDYHDNCHCYAEPVFSKADYRDSERFALNRQYSAEWPKVTKGLGGKAALAAWRRYIRNQQAQARSRARSQTTAQEASE